MGKVLLLFFLLLYTKSNILYITVQDEKTEKQETVVCMNYQFYPDELQGSIKMHKYMPF